MYNIWVRCTKPESSTTVAARTAVSSVYFSPLSFLLFVCNIFVVNSLINLFDSCNYYSPPPLQKKPLLILYKAVITDFIYLNQVARFCLHLLSSGDLTSCHGSHMVINRSSTQHSPTVRWKVIMIINFDQEQEYILESVKINCTWKKNQGSGTLNLYLWRRLWLMR